MEEIAEDIKENRKLIGRKLQFIREKLGYSQEYMAVLLCDRRINLSKWERGINNPPADYLILIAQLSHYELQSILDPKLELQPAKAIPIGTNGEELIRKYNAATPKQKQIVKLTLELDVKPSGQKL